jgi:SAM-dependent methyltransferase
MWMTIRGLAARWPMLGASGVTLQRISWVLRRPFAAARSRAALRRLVAQGKPLQLIVGAGAQRREGWVSTDIGPGAPEYMDITRALPLAARSVDMIFGEQVIEHLPKRTMRRFLSECSRVLKPGGILRVATPDMEAIARLYVADDASFRNAAERTRRTFPQLWSQVYGESATPSDLVNYFFYEHAHRYIYDFGTLRDLMVQSGLHDIRRTPYGVSSTPDLCGMEQHYSPEESPYMEPLTLIMEASR